MGARRIKVEQGNNRAYVWYVGSGQCWLKITSIVKGPYANKEGTPDPTNGARGWFIPAKPTYAPELEGFKVISDPKVGSMITSGAIIEGARIQMFGLTLEQCGQKRTDASQLFGEMQNGSVSCSIVTHLYS